MDARTVEIVSDKVAGLGPTWRAFRGITTLLEGAPRRFAGPGDALFGLLASMVGGLGAAATAERYGLCLLDPQSYHVTLCDGPNDRWLDIVPAAVLPSYRSLVDPGSDVVPDDLALLDPATMDARLSAAPITMRIESVQLTGHAVMAALVAADRESVENLRPLHRIRRAYADRLQHELALITPRWRPHVSVGYLVNPVLLDAARPLVDGWNADLAGRPVETATFRGAALYRFLDMQTYKRISR